MSNDTPFVIQAFRFGLKVAANIHTTFTPEQLEYYEQHLYEIPAALARGFRVPAPHVEDKFALLVDLGIITVPKGNPATRLARFREKFVDKFTYYNNDINDGHFRSPSRILKSGERVWVRAFEQVVSGVTTSDERMVFLATQHAIYTGAQGASLVFEQKRAQLPKGKLYASFDKMRNLWEDARGYYRVPEVYADSDGSFIFQLGNFKRPRSADDAFLCFCDVE